VDDEHLIDNTVTNEAYYTSSYVHDSSEDGKKQQKHDTMVAGYSSYCCCLLDTLRPTQTLHSEEIQNQSCVLTQRGRHISLLKSLCTCSITCTRDDTRLKRHDITKIKSVFMTHVKRENKHQTQDIVSGYY
jgi:hypothetical protein